MAFSGTAAAATGIAAGGSLGIPGASATDCPSTREHATPNIAMMPVMIATVRRIRVDCIGTFWGIGSFGTEFIASNNFEIGDGFLARCDTRRE